MTILEKKSNRKKIAIMNLVKTGEYSISYAMIEAERLNDEGKLLDADYEELAEYLEGLLKPVEINEAAEENEQLDTAVNSSEQDETETNEED